MKYLILTLMLALGTQVAQAQFVKKLGEAAERAAKRTVERRVEKESAEKTDEALDEVFERKSKKSKNKKNKKAKQEQARNAEREDNAVRSANDFVRGNKIIFHEQFDKVAIGDFPGTWNTNIGGEVVTFGNDNTRWLKLARGIFKPEGITNIPNNSTLEMDIRADGINNGTDLGIILMAVDDKNKLYTYNQAKNGVGVFLTAAYATNGRVRSQARVNGEGAVAMDWQPTKQFSGNKNTVHLSIWRQDSRIRVYLDDEKVIDLPRAFAEKNYNALMFDVNWTQIDYYVSNIILASDAGADTRHKLLETGSFTTNDILFDTGKSTLQASSFSVLDEIGEVMKANPSKALTVIGHTDSDGSDEANQVLSEQRAQSVKTYLMYKHNIDGGQITTLGKGESQPIASGNSAEAKAQNRRVEFKLN